MQRETRQHGPARRNGREQGVTRRTTRHAWRRRILRMGSGDFTRTAAETPLQAHYLVAGVKAAIATNSESILAAAGDCFHPVEQSAKEPQFRLRFWIDPRSSSTPPWPKPHFRGLDHLIYGGFDAQNSFLVDLRTRSVFGRFSPAMGSEPSFWKSRIFPAMTSILAASVGIVELHCGCVARDGQGILLAGRSGSGKSTLALAFAQAGFAYLSDNTTDSSRSGGNLSAVGTRGKSEAAPRIGKVVCRS